MKPIDTAALHGNLRSFRLPDLLSLLAATSKSGSLQLESAKRSAEIFFNRGAVSYASSNQENLRLGALLVRMTKITPSELEKLERTLSDEPDQLGRRAVHLSLLTEEQLRDCLKIQVSEIIFDCFVWTEGTFVFDEEAQIPVGSVTIAIDLPNLIMEGTRRIDEWERCHQLLPDPRMKFRVVSNPNTEEKITLTVDEWKVLFLINGQRSLDDLCRDSDEPKLKVYRVVYGLLANKLIEPISSGGSSGVLGSATVLVAPTPESDNAHVSTTVRQYPPILDSEATYHSPIDIDDEDDRILLVSPEAHLSYRDVVKTTVGRLTLKGPSDTNVNWPLTEQEYRIGRLRSNDIQLFDLSVSGGHARIHRSRDGFMIEDLSSRNGTFINGTRIQSTLLRDGDAVRFGATEVIYNEL